MNICLASATDLRFSDRVISMFSRSALRRLVVSLAGRTFLQATLFMLLCATARPDGYPFNPATQRVTVPSLRLKLTPEQTKEISATGTLTFGDEDLRLIRRHYPAATARTDVIAATYNDSVEGMAAVLCLWVAPDEVAITLDEKFPQDKSPFEVVMNDRHPTDAELQGAGSALLAHGTGWHAVSSRAGDHAGAGLCPGG